jgi:Tol biopolymer transport system component
MALNFRKISSVIQEHEVVKMRGKAFLRIFQFILLIGLLTGLSACNEEASTSAPATVALSATANRVEGGLTVTTAGVSPTAPKAATATLIPATPTALSSTAPAGWIAVVRDGKLILVNTEDNSIKEVTDLGADLSDKLALYWSPDGNRFLLNEANRKLTLIDSDGKRTPVLEVDPTTETFGLITWAATNRYIAFERIPAAEHGRETHSEIWLADLNDPTKPNLSDATAGFAPAFSPDGRNLAFATYGRDVSDKGGVNNNAINIISVGGKQSRQVLDVNQLPEFRNPDDGKVFELRPTLITSLTWSPDGRSLTFQDDRNFVGTVATTGGRVKVWWYNTAKEAGKIDLLNWSSRSDRLAFLFHPEADPTKQRLMVADNQNKTFSFNESLNCSGWSPDGSLLATANGKELNVLRVSDQKSYGTAKTSGCPIWSPDGVWLAVSPENGPDVSKGLLIVRPDGSDFHPITTLNATRQLKVLGWKK